MSDVLALLQRGLSFQERQPDEAMRAYKTVLRREPRHPDAWHLMGMLYRAKGDFGKASECILKALSAVPNEPLYLSNLALVRQDQGQIDDALGLYDRALSINPQFALAQLNKGVLLQGRGKLREALAAYEAAEASEPSTQAIINQGLVHQALDDYPSAISCFKRAVAADPSSAEALANLGACLEHDGALKDAQRVLERAIAIDPGQLVARCNLAGVLWAQGAYSQALRISEATVRRAPNFLEGWLNHGGILAGLARYAESADSYANALRLEPASQEAKWGMGLAWLAQGRLNDAWPLYETRIGYAKLDKDIPKMDLSRWSPARRDQPLLIVGEQGIGDTVFFAALLRCAHELSDAVTVRVDARLVPLFSRSFPNLVFEDIDGPSALDRFGSMLPIGSVFSALGELGALDYRALMSTPYLQADAVRAVSLRRRLDDGRRLCGVAWSSRRRGQLAKGVALTEILPVLRTPGVRFVNVQYGDVAQELKALQDEHGIVIEQLSDIDHFADIDAHAALIDACDVVLMVSNASAHLAGALGKPGVVMLPDGKGRLFYWSRQARDAGHWYQSLQTIQQGDSGGWDSLTQTNWLHQL